MKIELDTETDFTPAALRDYLNNRFKNKATGKKFTMQDIQQYVLRGIIPPSYGGGFKVEVIESDEIGIKILRVKGIREK